MLLQACALQCSVSTLASPFHQFDSKSSRQRISWHKPCWKLPPQASQMLDCNALEPLQPNKTFTHLSFPLDLNVVSYFPTNFKERPEVAYDLQKKQSLQLLPLKMSEGEERKWPRDQVRKLHRNYNRSYLKGSIPDHQPYIAFSNLVQHGMLPFNCSALWCDIQQCLLSK